MAQLSLSYILLTYNQKNTVREAVVSALKQDVPDLEIVITDDHSTDGTFDEIEAVVAAYNGPHRIILNRNPKNLGLAGNIDMAHRLSSGDVLVAAAGDDLSYPQRCRRIQEAFSRGSPLLVCSYVQAIDPEGNPVPGDFRTALFYRSWNLTQAAKSKALYIGATGAWHRSLYENYGPMDPTAYEDLVFGFRAALEDRVTVLEEELVQYRLGLGLTSSDFSHADIAAFEEKRRKGFLAHKGVMHQRIKDAENFGLSGSSEVLRVLRRAQIKAALGLAYYENQSGAFTSLLLRHPLLGLATWRSERRRRNKLRQQLQAQAVGRDG
ncbi:glycosyltransferase [Shimia sp.]|uniref:glycosyltransferase n=1 Tax=Shimia sp. TaxID=1954381 RepID=UPI003BAB36EA